MRNFLCLRRSTVTNTITLEMPVTNRHSVSAVPQESSCVPLQQQKSSQITPLVPSQMKGIPKPCEPSRFNVIFASTAKKHNRIWKDGMLIVSEGRTVLYDITLQKSVASCGGASGAKNAMFSQMASRAGKSFNEGDELIMNGVWAVQIITVMHRHLCPYDDEAPSIAIPQAGPTPLSNANAKQLKSSLQVLHPVKVIPDHPFLAEISVNSQNLPSYYQTGCYNLSSHPAPPPPTTLMPVPQAYLTGLQPRRTNAEVLYHMRSGSSGTQGHQHWTSH
ncbi:Hypothetical protein, putative [Bodo saltans]|uniref:DUF2439 domain-containing protein n=1 Tax=Bodo saltans TaxID=75058 RepID=A0A0S4JRI5_BODSA|nr:Hypothetical protein, putative [Bodo saltans]|eukprot:CUG92818.1 Hypothetical protein, putative [Bodo saltans]